MCFSDRVASQYLGDLAVAHLPKIAIVEADGAEVLVILKADDFVGLIPQVLQRGSRRDGNCQHQPPRAAGADRLQCGAHGRAGRNTIIDDDGHSLGDRSALATSNVSSAPPFMQYPRRPPHPARC